MLEVLRSYNFSYVQASEYLFACKAGYLFPCAVNRDVVALQVVGIDNVVSILKQRSVSFFALLQFLEQGILRADRSLRFRAGRFSPHALNSLVFRTQAIFHIVRDTEYPCDGTLRITDDALCNAICLFAHRAACEPFENQRLSGPEHFMVVGHKLAG